MKFDILTLFPDYFASPLKESLIAKAIETGKLEVGIHNLRNYGLGAHKQVDDTPYGGGAGMVLKADVLAKAVKDLKDSQTKVILTDPGGLPFKQEVAESLSKEKRILLIAGRYEGVDQRFKDKYVDLEISIGDYVLNGGEVATLVILESIARLVPNVIGSAQSLEFESFSNQEIENKKQTLLEYPQYTKPQKFEGVEVPKTLLSGNHGEIKDWRLQKALERTKKQRPDLLK